MSSQPWTVDRTFDYLGVHEISGFRLRTYSIAAPGREAVVSETLDALHGLTANLGREALSEEFEYHRVGFCVLNIGRRGVTVLLLHFGAWVDTPEIFQLSWYRYDGDDEFKLLDSAEPIACYIDSPILLSELTLWRGLARAQLQVGNDVDFDRLYESYLAAEPEV